MKLKNFLLEETSKGFDVRDIEKETVANNNFRKVLYTGKNTQLVLMTLQPNEDIGNEVHKNVDQFFRIEEGEGKVVINEKEEVVIKAGSSVVIRQGTYHNIINTSPTKKMFIYTLYSPPHHIDGTVHKTKEDAKADKKDEEFGNKPILEATKVTHGKYVKFSPKELAILKRHFDPKDFDDIRVSPGGASAAVFDTAGEEGTKFYVEKVQYKDEYVYTYAVTAFSEAGSDETLAEEESKPFDKEDLKLLEKTLQKMMLEEW